MSTTETTASGVGPVEGAVYDVDNPAPLIEAPRKRTKKTPKSTRGNFQLVLDGGVSKIGFAFVAGRWASPFWQVWDLLMLWLAMLHGANGLRTVINDYAERANTRLWLKGLLYTATVFTILLGSLVIFTFDPNIR
jgi:succinate dehydrogenase / fumarate reductase membrane anchor subunit